MNEPSEWDSTAPPRVTFGVGDLLDVDAHSLLEMSVGEAVSLDGGYRFHRIDSELRATLVESDGPHHPVASFWLRSAMPLKSGLACHLPPHL